MSVAFPHPLSESYWQWIDSKREGYHEKTNVYLSVKNQFLLLAEAEKRMLLTSEETERSSSSCSQQESEA